MAPFFCATLYIHQMNQLNSRSDLCHDDSTINIVLGINPVLLLLVVVVVVSGIC